jgi:hypothetical protein
MHNITHDVDHYEIGAGHRQEIGDGPSISEDAFPQDISLGYRLEIGAGDDGEDEAVGADTAAAVKQVIKTARDARQPPPKMKAVDVEAPMPEDADAVSEWFADVAVGVGVMIGAANPFPITTKLLTRFGAGQEKPRYVRVDTEESYKAFCAEHSPEMFQMQSRLRELASRLEDHIRDPDAHEGASEDLLDAIDEAEYIGAEVTKAEAAKTIEMWLPEWARGKIRAWREGEFICASMKLPGADGEVRICTSMTPVVRAVEEMERHAAAANVSAAAIVGVLPAMGCVLGAGTLVKEMASAAPALLQRPEAAKAEPFVVRIEPKANPALCALTALLMECQKGTKGACEEWNALADAAGKGAPVAAQAMSEAKNLFLKAKGKTVVGADALPQPVPPPVVPQQGLPGGSKAKRRPLYRGDTVTIQGD